MENQSVTIMEKLKNIPKKYWIIGAGLLISGVIYFKRKSSGQSKPTRKKLK